MLSKENPFVLLGMEHNLTNVDSILASAKRSFSSGSKILVELPESEITYALLLGHLAKGVLPPKEILSKMDKYSPFFFKDDEIGKSNKEFISQAIKELKAKGSLHNGTKRVFVSFFEKSFNCRLVNGLMDMGITPIEGESRFVVEKSKTNSAKDKSIVTGPLREKFFVKRILKGIKNQSATGAIYGAFHINAIRQGLQHNSIPVRTEYAAGSKMSNLLFKSRMSDLIFLDYFARKRYAKLRQRKKMNLAKSKKSTH